MALGLGKFVDFQLGSALGFGEFFHRGVESPDVRCGLALGLGELFQRTFQPPAACRHRILQAAEIIFGDRVAEFVDHATERFGERLRRWVSKRFFELFVDAIGVHRDFPRGLPDS